MPSIARISLVLFSFVSLLPGCASTGSEVERPPQARFRLGGTAVAEATQAPIAGIQVRFAAAETLTDEQGAWSLETLAEPCDPCVLDAVDPDGELNGGAFAARELQLSIPATAEGDPELREAQGITITLAPAVP